MSSANHYFDQSLAIVVGINHYSSKEITNLKTAQKDAESLATVLSQHGYSVKTFLNESATYENICAYLKNLKARLKTESTLPGMVRALRSIALAAYYCRMLKFTHAKTG